MLLNIKGGSRTIREIPTIEKTSHEMTIQIVQSSIFWRFDRLILLRYPDQNTYIFQSMFHA